LKLIEFRRRTLGYSQVQLGALPSVRIASNFISLIEQGRGVPTDDQARRLAAALNCEAADLLKEIALGSDGVTAHVDEPTHAS
jgi:transcriptional regulator with XRE-family HTH domain